MSNSKVVYKNFPLRIVLYRAPLLVGTLVIGGIVSNFLGWIGLVVYLVYTVTAILWTMDNVCRNCAYHGKRCDLGVSLVASLIHPQKGTTKVFREKVVTALWMLGTMLFVPLIMGVVSLVGSYSLANLIWVVVYSLAVTAVIWTTVLSCPHCAMRAICPLSFYKP